MGTPIDHLPNSIDFNDINQLLTSLGFDETHTSITAAKLTAQYHGIYFITTRLKHTEHNISPSIETLCDSSSSLKLVLRVSGNHLPYIKTENEIAVMRWVAANTTIPIPTVIAHDSTPDNVIGHEYTLLSRADGEVLSDVYGELSERSLVGIIDELIDILVQLQTHSWNGIGGLKFDNDTNQIHLGRVVDETFWQAGDIHSFWPEAETVDSLNIGGPYSNYVELISAQIRTYIRLINIHESLEFMQKDIPLLEKFISTLYNQADALRLNQTQLCLAHKDMHFANILIDRQTNKISAILDWEFAGVVPLTMWNPRKAFLWNGRDDDTAMPEKKRLYAIFETRCKERGISFLRNARFVNKYQESMQKVADCLRAITEVCPRGQRQDLVVGWSNTVLQSIAVFDSLPVPYQ